MIGLISPRQLDTIDALDSLEPNAAAILRDRASEERRVLMEAGLLTPNDMFFGLASAVSRGALAAHAASDSPMRAKPSGSLDPRPTPLLADTVAGGDVAEVVNQIEDNPYLFAVRFLNLARITRDLHADLEAVKAVVSRLQAHEVV